MSSIIISHPVPNSLTKDTFRMSRHRNQKTLNQSLQLHYAFVILALPSLLIPLPSPPDTPSTHRRVTRDFFFWLNSHSQLVPQTPFDWSLLKRIGRTRKDSFDGSSFCYPFPVGSFCYPFNNIFALRSVFSPLEYI